MTHEAQPKESWRQEEELHLPTSQSPLLGQGQTSRSVEQQGTLLLEPDAETPTNHGISPPLLRDNSSKVPSQPKLESGWPSMLPPPAPRWACGQQRQELRDAFNTLEINAVQILRTYDFDNSGALDVKELKPLLQDYSARDKPVSDADVSYVMMIADKNHDEKIDQHEILYGLRAWHAWNHMPMSVGTAFTRYKIGQGFPLPSVQAMQQVMLTLNEHQPVEIEEVEHARSLAMSLGATDERATTDQMRKAIAAWYINIERAETPAGSLVNVSLQDAQNQVTTGFDAIKQQADSIVDGGVDNSLTSLTSSDKLKTHLQNMPWQTLLPVVICMLLIVLPYVILVLVVLVNVITEQRTGKCEKDLKAPLTGWVVTEIAFWIFAASFCCTFVELPETTKRLGGSAIGLARFFIVIMGMIATTQSDRRHCNEALYDLSTFLFIYTPLFILALLCCVPLLTGCCIVLPSLRSATTADQQIAGTGAP